MSFESWTKVSGTWKQITEMWIKISGVWKEITEGWIKVAGSWKQFFGSAPLIPTQITAPGDPSGSGASFTSVTKGSSGTYSNYSTRTTSIAKIPAGTTVSDGLTTAPTIVSSPYTVTQSDATTPHIFYYTVDAVTNVAGTDTYYFYSSNSIEAFIPSFSDNFNRANTVDDLGTGSSGYVYSSYRNPNPNDGGATSWRISNNEAATFAAVSSSAAGTDHPLRSVEIAKTNIDVKAAVPNGKGGPGVAFWVTARGSWWATIPYYDFSSTSTSTCTGAQIVTDPSGTGCGGCPVTTLTCTSGLTVYANPGSCSCPIIATYSNYFQSCSTVVSGLTTCTTGAGCNQYCSCSPYSETIWSCTGSTGSCSGSNCYLSQGTFVSTCTGSGQKCNLAPITSSGIVIGWTWRNCASSTVTRYNGVLRTCSDGYGCYTGSSYRCNPLETTVTSNYYSYLRIISSSSSVVSQASLHQVASSNSNYISIYGIAVSTNGDNITAIAYSDTALTTQLGTTLSYSATGPTKANANGETAIGVIRGYSSFNESTSGHTLDNFTYTRI